MIPSPTFTSLINPGFVKLARGAKKTCLDGSKVSPARPHRVRFWGYEKICSFLFSALLFSMFTRFPPCCSVNPPRIMTSCEFLSSKYSFGISCILHLNLMSCWFHTWSVFVSQLCTSKVPDEAHGLNVNSLFSQQEAYTFHAFSWTTF